MSAPVRQRMPEWIEARRSLVTSTDIAKILGLSPFGCEADVAADKLGTAEPVEETLRMRVGTALEPLILEEWQRQTGRRARAVRRMHVSAKIPWAAASLDARVVGAPEILELKWSASRSRWSDGLPQDYEAQVRWAMGVAGARRAHVAALVGDGLLPLDPVDHDEQVFADMVDAAADFRRRLAAGGPFAQSGDSASRTWPRDDGSEIRATEADALLAQRLRAAKAAKRAAEAEAEQIEAAVKARIGEHSALAGDGWRITWKRSRDGESVAWPALAAELVDKLPESERDALVRRHTSVQEGRRYLRLAWKGED